MPARCSSVDGRTRSFSKTLTSNGHMISVTIPFRPLLCACCTIHQGPRKSFVFKFIRIGVDGESFENDTKTIV